MKWNPSFRVSPFPVEIIRREFPILNRKIHQWPLIYFDNAATSQKPLSVIRASEEYYSLYNANVHRGVHYLSSQATLIHENIRQKISGFLGCEKEEIVFTSGTTHGINIVAHALKWKKGDEIILTELEHHSNILPWQIISQRYGVTLRVLPLKDNLRPDWDMLEKWINEKTRLLSFVHLSNTLGCLLPAASVIKKVREKAPHVLILLDGAQSFAHQSVNLGNLSPDFFVCSMHKAYGPTGVGILYIKKNIQEQLHPAFSGGGTIREVSWEQTVYETGPVRFEPGTPHLEGVYASGASVDFMEQIGREIMHEQEQQLTRYALEKLYSLEEIEVYSRGEDICSVISFNVKNAHPYDVGTLLDQYGIAVRTGHHCTQPLMKKLGIPGTIRISFAVYNCKEEIDFFYEKLKKCILMLR